MLPNLPALSGDWFNEWLSPSLSLTDWVIVLPADPTRWAIRFITSGTGAVLLSTIPEPTASIGDLIGFGQSRDWFYKDFGPLVQQDWYGFDKGGGNGLLVVTACIRKLTPRTANAREDTANVS